jgi:putative polyhydroxyalkanoic acid system protein
MSTPLTISIPHRLGKAEASRRIRDGFSRLRGNLSALLTIDQEQWSNESTVRFQMHGLGQSAAGTIEVLDDSVRVEVTLPWLLEKFAERLLPTLRKEATLLLEKK